MKIIVIDGKNRKEVQDQITGDMLYEGFNLSELIAENLKEIFDFEPANSLEIR